MYFCQTIITIEDLYIGGMISGYDELVHNTNLLLLQGQEKEILTDI